MQEDLKREFLEKLEVVKMDAIRYGHDMKYRRDVTDSFSKLNAT